MPTLTEVKLTKLHEFRMGVLDLKKADLTPKLISSYWESNRDKLRPSGIVDNLGRYIQSIQDVDDVDALDDARNNLIVMLDDTIAALSGAPVRPILDDLILKVKDTKLSTLLKEFNAIKDHQPNFAAIGLRTIICLIIQDRAKIIDAKGKLATRQDLALDPMLTEAIAGGTFPQGETKLLQGFQSRGQKVMFDNVVHKPGDNMLVKKDDLSAAVDLLNKLLPTIV